MNKKRYRYARIKKKSIKDPVIAETEQEELLLGEGQAPEELPEQALSPMEQELEPAEASGPPQPAKLPRKTLVIIISSVVVLAALVVTFVALYLGGAFERNGSVVGSWQTESSTGNMYLTLQEDGTAIMTSQGLSVAGTYNLLEHDICAVNITAMGEAVMVEQFHYWATDTTLTFTRLEADSQPAASESEANTLKFTKLEADITQVAPPSTPQVDASLVGTWSDIDAEMIYTFRADGTMEQQITRADAYISGTYMAQNGKLTVLNIVGGDGTTTAYTYEIADGILNLNGIELAKVG